MAKQYPANSTPPNRARGLEVDLDVEEDDSWLSAAKTCHILLPNLVGRGMKSRSARAAVRVVAGCDANLILPNETPEKTTGKAPTEILGEELGEISEEMLSEQHNNPDLLPNGSEAFRHNEAKGLVSNIGMSIWSVENCRVRKIHPATYIGQGQVEKIAERFRTEPADVFFIDCNLSALQQRNLERALLVPVLDRTALILTIFGLRAKTHEGRLQVKLAKLVWRRTRLVRGWTHLERQRGGVGFIAGGGETQLELDRRDLDQKKELIERKLGQVRVRRTHQRARRAKEFPRVALVGYTNAGKSSLFNRLTHARGGGVVASSRPFETLDPTSRRMRLRSGRDIILTDTVGFIKDLPTLLVASFRATLEEATEADLVLVVRDGSLDGGDWLDREVDAVLEQLEIGPSFPDSPQMLDVFNKVDLLRHKILPYNLGPPSPPAAGCGDSGVTPDGLNGDARTPSGFGALRVSALTGEGIELLHDVMDRELDNDQQFAWVYPNEDPAGADAVSFLYRHTRSAIEPEVMDGHMRYRVTLSHGHWARLKNLFPELRVERPRLERQV